jgi:undecaprenyl-diphosphatase
MNPEVAIFYWLNRLTGKSILLDTAARYIVNDYALPALFAFVLGACWFAGKDEPERERFKCGVLWTCFGVLIANLIVKLCWMTFFRPRPFAALDDVNVLLYRPSVSSFPSEPVATLTALACGVFLFERRVGAIMILLTLLFALTRVMAGAHYPSDVIAGALLGASAVYLPYRHVPALNGWFMRVIGLAKRFGLA